MRGSPGSAPLNAVAFIDATTGCAVGDRGTIIRTQDGGASWQRQETSSSATLVCIAFSDDQHGIIGGPPGAVLSTSDGGQSWTRSVLPSWARNDSVVDIEFSDAHHGFATLGQTEYRMPGSLMITDDGGLHWREVKLPEYVSVTALALDEAGDPWVATYDEDHERRAYVMHSRDPGQTWTVQRPVVALLDDLWARGSQVCGVGEVILTSADASHWALRSSNHTAFDELQMLDPTTGWAANRVGGAEDINLPENSWSVIMKTADGLRWNEQALLKQPVSTMAFVDAQHGWIATGTRGALLETHDGGATWTEHSLGTRTWFEAVTSLTRCTG